VRYTFSGLITVAHLDQIQTKILLSNCSFLKTLPFH